MVKTWRLTARQCCDLELLLVGGFAPLQGFLSQMDYDHVLNHMRLSTHEVWPIPITLDVSQDFAESLHLGEVIALLDKNHHLIAHLTVSDRWIPDKQFEAQSIYGTLDEKHPGVDYLLNQAGPVYLGGRVTSVQSMVHYDFPELRMTPQSLKQLLLYLGWETVIGFQTRNPIHRAHMEIMQRAAQLVHGKILLHPVVGATKPGDVDAITRVRCYQKIIPYFPPQSVLLGLLPLAMRMAGPREAVWHALIRKNYGCSHFIIGRDHAGPGNDATNTPFYEPYAAQTLALQLEPELGIKIITLQEMVYVKERAHYVALDEVQPHETALQLSGTELRHRLMHQKKIPDWFSYPEVLDALKHAYPSPLERGFTVFFTGLSGAGKSTLANALQIKLNSIDTRKVAILDGDVMRALLGNTLGFSKEDRLLNIRIMSYMAAKITEAGGIALCAAIAPYESARSQSRSLITEHGGFVEIYVATPLHVCEARDVKGLYQKAKIGALTQLTGVDDPYEPPQNPDLSIDTTHHTIEENIQQIMDVLEHFGLIKHSIMEQYPHDRLTSS